MPSNNTVLCALINSYGFAYTYRTFAFNFKHIYTVMLNGFKKKLCHFSYSKLYTEKTSGICLEATYLETPHISDRKV